MTKLHAELDDVHPFCMLVSRSRGDMVLPWLINCGCQMRLQPILVASALLVLGAGGLAFRANGIAADPEVPSKVELRLSDNGTPSGNGELPIRGLVGTSRAASVSSTGMPAPKEFVWYEVGHGSARLNLAELVGSGRPLSESKSVDACSLLGGDQCFYPLTSHEVVDLNAGGVVHVLAHSVSGDEPLISAGPATPGLSLGEFFVYAPPGHENGFAILARRAPLRDGLRLSAPLRRDLAVLFAEEITKR